MAGIVEHAARSGRLDGPHWAPPLTPLGSDAAAAMQTLIDLAFPHASAQTAVRAVAAWTQLFGIISFELFGHFHRVIEQPSPVFERALLEMGRVAGLPDPWARPGRADGTQADAAQSAEPDHVDDEDWYLV